MVLRDELVSEGTILFSRIKDEYFEFARHQEVVQAADGEVISKSIPWMETEAICIALALYARRQKS